MQVLQRAEQWCPQAEKVFVNPTGQIVDPKSIQESPAQAESAQNQQQGTVNLLST